MDNEDRISYLPRDINDHIFELLPVEDAARTSILSTKWRYVWATVPNLVLDKLFCNKLALRSRYILKQTIDEILLQHIGNIVKFDVDISGVELSLCPNIDGWILYATRNNVKELKLNMPNDSTYKCNGTQCLNIVSAGLEYLFYDESRCNLDLSCFMKCKQLTCLYLKVENYSMPFERLTLEKLLLSLTTLEILLLSSFELELLSAGEVPKTIPFKLNFLYHLHLGVNFTQISQTYYAFELIKSCPNLSKLEIWVNNSSDTVEAVLKYIDTPTFLDQPLKDVTVHYFKGSKIELFFIKLLLACIPSLVRMSIIPVGSLEDWNIGIDLMRFPRASPKAELFYLKNVDKSRVDL
ncbi:hypothetical protein KY290_007343 [Solanum tuberosum]|uniref:F-box domain-containing protein n=1 Tax=Solanum tuberosum TaxID=4113 RepID=A0ABQ7W5E9_SOLTU|nr:hypothetical protein KY289_007663 [Solanum tuberosum]KAH0775932.1 hypothetical protein KY290_007343 [Solanum tuberosum]